MENVSSLLLELSGPIDGRSVNLFTDSNLVSRLLSFLESETKRIVVKRKAVVLSDRRIVVVFEPTSDNRNPIIKFKNNPRFFCDGNFILAKVVEATGEQFVDQAAAVSEFSRLNNNADSENNVDRSYDEFENSPSTKIDLPTKCHKTVKLELKCSDGSRLGPVRLTVPETMAQLKIDARKKLQLSEEIVGFCDIEETEVLSPTDVVSGETLVALTTFPQSRRLIRDLKDPPPILSPKPRLRKTPPAFAENDRNYTIKDSNANDKENKVTENLDKKLVAKHSLFHVSQRAELWNAMIGQCSVDELEAKLCDLSHTLTSEYDMNKLHSDYLTNVLRSSAPLLEIAKKLLPMIKHFQPWDSFLTKLSRHSISILKTALDYKTLLIMLQFYLPTGKAREVFERFVEMGKAVPFVVPVPMDPSCYVKEEMCVLLTNFRNLFDSSERASKVIGNVPFLLSCGTSETVRKSKFLNLAFHSDFAVASKSLFHRPSVDVTVSTKTNPLKFHILDYHGNANPNLVKCFTSFCSHVLLHIRDADVKSNNLAELVILLKALSLTTNAIILIRDVENRDANVVFEKRIRQETGRESIRFLYIPEIEDGESFAMEFNSILATELTAALKRDDWKVIPNYFETYDALESVVIASFKDVCSVKTRSQECATLSENINLQLGRLKNGSKAACDTLFPRTGMHNEIVEVEEKLKTITTEAKSESEKRMTDKKLRLKLTALEHLMENLSELDPLLELFRNLIDTGEISWYEEFAAVIRSASRYGLYLSMEQFWREVMFYMKNMAEEKRNRVIKFAKKILKWGYPIEVLNGDSLAVIELKSMIDILEDGDNSLMVCSVIGPQSSAKSTLMNYLFGSSFQVSAGRCTKGMHLSLFDAESYGVPGLKSLAVLDTEGLLSATARNSAFDKQMTLMALALSNVVLINIKGEIGSDMRHVLDVTLLGLKMLNVIHAKPKMLFVLRDMTDLDVGRQQEAIQRIRTEMRDICKSIQFEFEELAENSFVLLPPAINSTHSNCFFLDGDAFVRNPTFSLKIGELLNRICESQPNRTKSSNSSQTSPFSNLQEWIQHLNTTWLSVKQCGHLLHYKCLQEYFDRQRLSEMTTQICDIFTKDFLDESKQMGGQLIIDQSTDVYEKSEFVKLKFREKIESIILPKYLKRAEDQFDKDVAGRNISDGLEAEYRSCIITRSQLLLENALREFNYRVGFRVVQLYSQAGIDEIKEWIDRQAGLTYADHGTDKVLTKFEEFWSSQRKILENRLKSMRSGQQNTWIEIRNIFSSLLRLRPELSGISMNFAEESAVEEYVALHNMALQGKISGELLCRYVLMAYYHKVKFIGQFLGKHEIRTTFAEAVISLSACIASITASLKSIDSVEHGVIELFFLIQSKNNLLNRHHVRFAGTFYSICFSNLFHSILKRIEISYKKKVEESINEFDKHKPALQQAFLHLLHGRFDDTRTAHSIVELIAEQMTKSVSEKIDDEFLKQLQVSCSMSSQHLSQICEGLQGSQEIFNYVTDCPGFMKSIFKEHFKEENKRVLPSVESRFRDVLNARTRSLLQGVDDWKSIVMSPPLSQQVGALWKSDTNENFTALSRLLFQSFKMFLCQQTQPSPIVKNSQLVDAVKAVFILLDQQKTGENFQELFAAVPNSFAICLPSDFCSELQRNLTEITIMKKYEPNQHLLERACDRYIQEAVGCMDTCPLCRAKCTENNPGHTYHSTEAHRMTAFAGWHFRGTRNFTFRICTSMDSRNSSYYPTPETEISISFDELMEQHKWKVPLIENVRIETKNIFRWLQVREMLCRHYDLDDNTPEEWLDMKDGVCPVCLSSWNDAACGPKKQLSCGHFIGSLCYGRLLSRTETQHRCPVCRHPI